MSVKLVKITSYYKDFLSYYYQSHSHAGHSYNEQHQHLMMQRFAWSDAYAHAFSQLGWEASEIVANARPLQEQWCVENNVEAGTDKEIVLAQLKQLQPDVIWLQDSYSFNGSYIEQLRKEIPAIKLAIGNCCSPISPQFFADFMSFDFITVCAPYFKELLEKSGLPECLVVPHAFDGRILQVLHNDIESKHDFLFSGSLILDQNFHRERIQFLEQLVSDGIDINLLVNLNTSSSKGILLRQLAFGASRLFDKAGLHAINRHVKGFNKVSKLQFFPRASKVSERLMQAIKAPVFGLEMFREIRRSKISFNIHGDIASDFAANMRMYEVTGAGGCLLTDWKKDLNVYFNDDELVAYRSLAEAKEKIAWLLAHPNELEAIAQRGQKRTLTEHTFANRASLLAEAIRKRL
ncbi:glycosyltransferase family protein [Carboxylicivirga taeanensis]|uniref:glycosyltransferase family protein n=1 Tax=Carboxylicivirga taeanensis TaxID=1416875 RepID=UPI003F6DBC7E